MIVECQNCTTRFQLDDTRIPLAGIRVRCSKCKEAFFLEHPSATQEQAVEALAFDAVATETAPPPDATQDLVAPAAGAAFEDDEDDWEFNHDEPEDPALSMSNDTPSAGDSFSNSSSSSSIELATSQAAPRAAAPVAAPEPQEDELSGLDPETTFASGASDDEVPFDESDVDIADLDIDGIEVEGLGGADSAFDLSAPGDLGGDAHPDGSVDNPSASLHAAEPQAAAAHDSYGEIDTPSDASDSIPLEADLGEPEDWDLLGEDLPAPPVAPCESGSASGAVIGAIALTRMPSPHAAEAAIAVPDARSSSAAPHRLQGQIRRAGAGVGWLLTLSLLAATVWQGVTRSVAIVYSPAQTQFEVGPLVARSIETSWIATREGQTLLAVRGELHNPTSSPLMPELAVMVSLLDESGVPLDRPSREAGRMIEPETLRDLEAMTRQQLALDASAMLGAVTLAGGKSVEFAAYFSDVPAAARRISVEGVEPEVTYDAGQDLIWGAPASDGASAEVVAGDAT